MNTNINKWSGKTLVIIASLGGYISSALLFLVISLKVNEPVTAKFLAILIPNLILLGTNTVWRSSFKLRGDGKLITGTITTEDGLESICRPTRKIVIEWYVSCLASSIILTAIVLMAVSLYLGNSK